MLRKSPRGASAPLRSDEAKPTEWQPAASRRRGASRKRTQRLSADGGIIPLDAGCNRKELKLQLWPSRAGSEWTCPKSSRPRKLHQWWPRRVKSHVAELPRPRDFPPGSNPFCAPAAKLPPNNHWRRDIPSDPKRGPRSGRDRLRLGEARASSCAKAALRGRAGSCMREVTNPRTIPFSQFVWRATPPHGIGPSRPLAATYRAVGGHISPEAILRQRRGRARPPLR